ncbi:MAG: hypothetical protein VXX33_14690 [Pseudomonadota bacterium]|nr:hypothetical protein [Pseudomonadota bacterium]
MSQFIGWVAPGAPQRGGCSIMGVTMFNNTVNADTATLRHYLVRYAHYTK